MRKLSLAAFATALGALAAPAAVAAGPGVGLGQAYPVACASGYHPDRGGNCQPDVEEQNRFCPRGEVIHSAFNGNGYICEPPPPEAY
jgi:hypothetical protein